MTDSDADAEPDSLAGRAECTPLAGMLGITCDLPSLPPITLAYALTCVSLSMSMSLLLRGVVDAAACCCVAMSLAVLLRGVVAGRVGVVVGVVLAAWACVLSGVVLGVREQVVLFVSMHL